MAAMVLSGHFAAAALPGKATLISPSGTASTDIPTYSWNADAYSTWYYLWVNDSTGTRIQKWYTADQVGCPGAGICYATPDIPLAPGSAKWWIQTWSPTGNGPWSDAMAFTVKTPEPPRQSYLDITFGDNGQQHPHLYLECR